MSSQSEYRIRPGFGGDHTRAPKFCAGCLTDSIWWGYHDVQLTTGHKCRT